MQFISRCSKYCRTIYHEINVWPCTLPLHFKSLDANDTFSADCLKWFNNRNENNVNIIQTRKMKWSNKLSFVFDANTFCDINDKIHSWKWVGPLLLLHSMSYSYKDLYFHLMSIRFGNKKYKRYSNYILLLPFVGI